MNHEMISIPFPENLRKRGFFVLEGIDGSGKSTQFQKLCAWFQSKKLLHTCLIEPKLDGTGKILREKFMDDKQLTAEEELNMILLDRSEDVVQNINPAIEAGKIILMDRYIYSNAVYQGVRLGAAYVLNENIKRQFPFPEKTFLFDLPEEQALERISQRGHAITYFEKISFLTDARKIYLNLIKWDKNIEIINANAPQHMIFEQLQEKMTALLKTQ